MNEELEDYLDSLIDVVNSIDPNEVTILTGRNGGGKSLIRKLLTPTFKKKLGKNKVTIPHASQELRTGSHASMGALGSMTRDPDWLATSHSTIHTIKMVLAAEKADYYVIDEPEIGLGEELQLGLVDWLNESLKTINKGVLVIAHSRILVNGLNHDRFINLEGMSCIEWLNRVPQKVSLEQFEEFTKEFFKVVKSRLKSN